MGPQLVHGQEYHLRIFEPQSKRFSPARMVPTSVISTHPAFAIGRISVLTSASQHTNKAMSSLVWTPVLVRRSTNAWGTLGPLQRLARKGSMVSATEADADDSMPVHPKSATYNSVPS